METLLGFLSFLCNGHGYGHLGLIGHGLCFKASSNDNRLAPFSPKNLSGPLQSLTLQHFRRVFCDIIIKFENRFARWWVFWIAKRFQMRESDLGHWDWSSMLIGSVIWTLKWIWGRRAVMIHIYSLMYRDFSFFWLSGIFLEDRNTIPPSQSLQENGEQKCESKWKWYTHHAMYSVLNNLFLLYVCVDWRVMIALFCGSIRIKNLNSGQNGFMNVG